MFVVYVIPENFKDREVLADKNNRPLVMTYAEARETCMALRQEALTKYNDIRTKFGYVAVKTYLERCALL